MKTLTLEGREFVKAAELAKEIGYTADYVGQLCRGGKVEAQLVGRTWYVERDSLVDHKRGRYKKTTTEKVRSLDTESSTDDVLEVQLHAGTTPTEPTKTPVVGYAPTNSTSHSSRQKLGFYTRVKRQPTAAAYQDDDTHLIPELPTKKSRRIAVGLADASSVPIRSESKATTLEATERPKVRFKGTLAIDDVVEEEAPKKEPVKKSSKKTKKLAVKGDSGPKKSVLKVPVSVSHQAPKMSFKERLSATKTAANQVPAGVTTDTVSVALYQSHPDPLVVHTQHYFVVSVTTALFILIALLGVEHQLQFDTELVTSSYTFAVDTLIAAVNGYK